MSTTETAPVSLNDFEEIARQRLPASSFAYFKRGANAEQTLQNNHPSWNRWRLRPRVLCPPRNGLEMKTTLLGSPVSMPVCLAPTAFQLLAHKDAEKATSRAAAAEGVLMTVSTSANTPVEEVSQAGGTEGLLWSHVYIFVDRVDAVDLIRRAEASGYKALVISVDVPIVGRRWTDARHPLTLPPGFDLPNHYIKTGTTEGKPSMDELISFLTTQYDPSLTWDTFRWLKTEVTKLPIIAKGILSGADARLALDAGVDAIWVSNHGGRQLDCVPATADVLAEVIAAVDGRCEVYVDGGIRTGTDVIKALAMGARAVFLGRPTVYGLAYAGEEGVRRVLQIIRREVEVTMALSGVSNIQQIYKDLLIHETSLPSKL